MRRQKCKNCGSDLPRKAFLYIGFLSALAWTVGLPLAAFAAESWLTLLAIGDTGDCRTEGAAKVAAALRNQPDAQQAVLVELGDLAYPTATRERLLACHEPHFGGFPKRLAVPGNHDWLDSGAAGFFSIFPEPVPRVVDLAGSWRMLLLDSNLNGAAWKAQLAWLDLTLKDSGGKCLIAAWHHPRRSSGRHGDDAAIEPIWSRVAGHATLTLHGHDHHYESLAPRAADGSQDAKGTRSFVVGHGGSFLYPVRPPKEGSVAVFGQWGFLRVDLAGNIYRWQALSVDGKVVDSGSGACLER